MEEKNRSTTHNIIITLIKFIKINDIEKFHNLLNKLPVDKLLLEASNTLLSTLLEEAVKSNNSPFVSSIIEKWQNTKGIQDDISFFASLFLIDKLNIQLLEKLTEIYTSHTFFSVVTEMISWEDNENVFTALTKTQTVYGPQSYDIYETLYNEAKDKDHEQGKKFLSEYMNLTSPYQEIPEWMNNFLGEDAKIPYNNQLEIPKVVIKEEETIPTAEEYANNIVRELNDSGLEILNIEDIRREAINKYESMSDDEKINYTSELNIKYNISKQQNDVTLFRLLGPSNLLIEASGDELKYGGDRMFIANTFDWDEDDNNFYDWFTGNCDVCFKKIRVKWHAVRMPHESGGWLGCYCSWKCVRNDILQPNKIIPVMVNELEEAMKKIGIQDRIDDADPESYEEALIYNKTIS
jgi:hypothetical protein